MNIVLWITQIVLAWIYSPAVFRKLFQREKLRANQEWARQSSDGYIRFIAISQLLGVAGMLFPILAGVFPWLTPLAAIGFCIIQILAAQWHTLEGIQDLAREFISIRTLPVYRGWSVATVRHAK